MVRGESKWVELWLYPRTEGEGATKWDDCCKWYMLNEVVEKAGLNEHVLNHGLAGIYLLWPPGDRPIAAALHAPPELEDLLPGAL